MNEENKGLMAFYYEDFQVRKLDLEGEVWFVAKDVAEALGYSSTNMTQVFSHVPDEWKGSNPIATPGGNQDMICLSEQGLYFFLGRSDKPAALPFQKWIAGEVLPAIRRQGYYAVPGIEGIGGGKVLERLIELAEKQQAVIETLVNGAAPRLSKEQFARFFLQTHVLLSEDPKAYMLVKDAFEYYRTMAYRGEGGKPLTISEFRVQIKTLFKDQVKTGVLENGQCVYYGCSLIWNWEGSRRKENEQ
jgi:prophage antirepressor-like protein